MATLSEIASGLMDAVGTIPGVTPVRVRAQDPLPTAVVIPPDFEYRGTFGADGYFGPLNFELHVLVGQQLSVEAVLKLWEFVEPVGAKSVMAAIERDRTLGGIVDDCAVMSFRRLDYEEVTGYGAWGGSWSVQVLASKETS